MNTKRIVFSAAILLAAAFPAVSMALADLSGVTGNGHVVEQERTVRAFTVVIATGSEEVRIHRGSDYRVIVTCDENLLPLYQTKVSGNRLELGFESGTSIRGLTKVKVDVWMPKLEGITLSGSGDMTAEDSFNIQRLDIVLSGSGAIEGQFEGGDVDAVISGSGSIDIRGSADRLKVSIAGSGDFRARDYAAEDAEVSIAGSGSVDLGKCEELNVHISGSGNVTYAGNPRSNVNVSGSGSVRRR